MVWFGLVWCGAMWCGVPKALLPRGKSLAHRKMQNGCTRAHSLPLRGTLEAHVLRVRLAHVLFAATCGERVRVGVGV